MTYGVFLNKTDRVFDDQFRDVEYYSDIVSNFMIGSVELDQAEQQLFVRLVLQQGDNVDAAAARVSAEFKMLLECTLGRTDKIIRNLLGRLMTGNGTVPVNNLQEQGVNCAHRCYPGVYMYSHWFAAIIAILIVLKKDRHYPMKGLIMICQYVIWAITQDAKVPKAKPKTEPPNNDMIITADEVMAMSDIYVPSVPPPSTFAQPDPMPFYIDDHMFAELTYRMVIHVYTLALVTPVIVDKPVQQTTDPLNDVYRVRIDNSRRPVKETAIEYLRALSGLSTGLPNYWLSLGHGGGSNDTLIVDYPDSELVTQADYIFNSAEKTNCSQCDMDLSVD